MRPSAGGGYGVAPVTEEDDPYRMYLVLRRGAIASLARAGELAGAAAVACLRGLGTEPEHADAVAAWKQRPGKVCLRARNPTQWEQVLELPHALSGDAEDEGVVALPPLRRSQRGPLLEKLQAMSGALDPLPERIPEAAADDPAATPKPVTYLVNPRLQMSTGKTIAQIAHGATAAAATGALEPWVAAGCPANVISPPQAQFDAMCGRDDLAAKIVDAGLTEVPPGTVTVLAVEGHA